MTEDVLEKTHEQKPPEQPERTLVIFHKECADGFTAAWVVRKALGEENCEFVAAAYGDEAVDCKGRDVVIVDFSYPREDMLKIVGDAESVVILDHHKTAKEALEGIFDYDNVEGMFSMERSGAMMAWDYFFEGEKAPFLVELIQDRDLWRFRLQGTKEFSALFRTFYFEFITWDFLAHHLEHPKTAFSLFEQGEAVERHEQKMIQDLIRLNERRLVIDGNLVPAVNAPGKLASDIGNQLLHDPRHPFSVVYSDDEKGRLFSLRSLEGGVDVSEIAKKYGGGGHANAAGFTVLHADVGQFEVVNNKVDDIGATEEEEDEESRPG